jgi:hypothetical protein
MRSETNTRKLLLGCAALSLVTSWLHFLLSFARPRVQKLIPASCCRLCGTLTGKPHGYIGKPHGYISFSLQFSCKNYSYVQKLIPWKCCVGSAAISLPTSSIAAKDQNTGQNSVPCNKILFSRAHSSTWLFLIARIDLMDFSRSSMTIASRFSL